MRIRKAVGAGALVLGAGLAAGPPAAAAAGPLAGPLAGDDGARVTAKQPGKAATTTKLGGGKLTKSATGGVKATGKATAKVNRSTSLRAVRCWDGWRRGRTFHEQCRGTTYRPFVDCSNGRRYVTTRVYSGHWEFWLYCPRGTRAIWGGAYD